MPRNLISVEKFSKSFDEVLVKEVSLGVAEGQRIGIVGRNGGGKSTLLKILAGVDSPDSGRITRANWARIGILQQADSSSPGSVRDFVVGSKKTHEWASDAGVREIFAGLFGGFSSEILDRAYNSLSGGEKRRVGLAKLLIEPLDLILLDEPTNHLDIEGVAWLAKHLRKRRELAVLVVTHDRWFLDEIADEIWEVVGGEVLTYEGGYSAYVLSKAERARQQAAEDARRNNLIRKELAWLRRGAPARTSKPKFRVDAANQLIATEPPPRDTSELLNFAANRLGNMVLEIHHAKLTIGENTLIDSLNWNIAPGDRIGIIGFNGSGKTTLMRALASEYRFAAGKMQVGVTVKRAFLSQHLEELDPSWRVLEAVERVALHVELGGGRELTASQLCERLGFDFGGQQRMIRDLSGGEKRRLQLTRLLMTSPNVLLLDEPTNDFDVETLAALEDLLDSFAGVLIVISHDRYFLERTCDRFFGLLGDEELRDLPRGIDEYLERRDDFFAKQVVVEKKSISGAAQERLVKKEIARLEKQLEKLVAEEVELRKAEADSALDYEALVEIGKKLQEVVSRREKLESEWLELSEQITR
ncbi:MAG: ABC-F family ATP-binding cassette domain-containing protein [Actinobacteria bacterium]|nr:ABC-F family ATP-binding cassette domain-containing protein [Actinomycetota bacterium]